MTQIILNNKTLWGQVLTEIELTVSKANFTTWFKDTFIDRYNDGTVFLSVPNTFVRDWLSKKYHSLILKSLRETDERIRALEYVISRSPEARKRHFESPAVGGLNISSATELPLLDLYVNREDNLNPRYTFESFVVGPFNEFAHAVSQAIIKKPLAYNPLFIYGSTGHGKTHLLQAIGNHLKVINDDKKVFYVTAERFAVDFLNSLNSGSGKVGLFKERYRKYDTLIMDDIQFIANKDRTQEELFHLFNALYDNNKQVVFSSDKHPRFVEGFEDRLRSRFDAGMIIEIEKPDFESRLQILRTKTAQMGFVLGNDVLEFLGATVDGNVRELEGALNLILCQSQLKNRDLSLVEIKNLVRHSGKPKRVVAVKDVVKTIADFYNIDEKSIYEKTRRKEVVRPRQVIMYFLREEVGISYPSIGEKLGGRDHTTVMHSCDKIKGELKTDHALSQQIEQLKAILV